MTIQNKIVTALETKVSPILQSHGGNVKFISFSEESGVLSVQLIGSCGSCPYAHETLRMTVETAIKQEVPEVKSVVRV